MNGDPIETPPEIVGAPRASLAGFEPDREQLRTAADWLLRLREKDRETSREFEQWLAADPAHEFAYAEVEALFAETAEPARAADWFFDRRERPGSAGVRRARRWWRAAGLAAAASIALALALPHLPDPAYLGADAVAATGKVRTVRLADGSRVTLNSASAIDADMGGADRRVRLRGGEAYFEVAKDARRPFLIRAGDAEVRVLGTKFNMRIDAGQTRIAVTEGHVRVAIPGGRARPVELVRGQEALVDAGAIQVQASDSYEATAWRDRKLLFAYVPLRLVVRDLNRYRRGHIYIANGALGDNLVSGVFRTDDPDGAIRIMERTMGISSMTLPTGQVILY